MEFIGLKIAGFVLYTVLVGYIGNKWAEWNSVSDVETQFKNIKDKVQQEIASAEATAAAATAKAQQLKTLA